MFNFTFCPTSSPIFFVTCFHFTTFNFKGTYNNYSNFIHSCSRYSSQTPSIFVFNVIGTAVPFPHKFGFGQLIILKQFRMNTKNVVKIDIIHSIDIKHSIWRVKTFLKQNRVLFKWSMHRRPNICNGKYFLTYVRYVLLFWVKVAFLCKSNPWQQKLCFLFCLILIINHKICHKVPKNSYNENSVWYTYCCWDKYIPKTDIGSFYWCCCCIWFTWCYLVIAWLHWTETKRTAQKLLQKP